MQTLAIGILIAAGMVAILFVPVHQLYSRLTCFRYRSGEWRKEAWREFWTLLFMITIVLAGSALVIWAATYLLSGPTPGGK